MNNLVMRADLQPDGSLCIAPFGSLDVFNFWKFQGFFEEKAALAGPQLRVMVDLSGLHYLNSSAWMVLLSQRRAVRRRGGEMVIFGMRPEVKLIYDVMTIHDVLPAVESLEDACRRLSNAPLAPPQGGHELAS